MKYCPYCGTELNLGAVSFCPECGKLLTEDFGRGPEPFVVRNKPEVVEEKRNVEWNIPYREKKKTDKTTYDGYYDDIILDDGMMHEQPKKDNPMIFKICLIIGTVIVIAMICIVALTLL